MTALQLWPDLAPRDGATQMAIDHALAELADADGVTVARCYRWARPTLSFGRHEPVGAHLAPERLQAHGVDAVRRPTGGRVVAHGRDVTYALAAPLARTGDLRAAYAASHAAIARGLAAVGLGVAVAPVPRAVARPDAGSACFDDAVGGELLLGGRKVLGSAQRRVGGVLLQHGALLLPGPPDAAERLLGAGSTPSADDVAASAPPADVLATAILAGLTEWLGPAMPFDAAPVLARAASLRATYADPAWTWAR